MTTFGPTYDPKQDSERITGQMRDVRDVMQDGSWRTLEGLQATIESRVGRRHPSPSLSAQLRHLRKERFGGHRLEKRRVRLGDGLWEYRLLPPEPKGVKQIEMFERIYGEAIA